MRMTALLPDGVLGLERPVPARPDASTHSVPLAGSLSRRYAVRMVPPIAVLPDDIAAWRAQPRSERLDRLGRTPLDLARLIASRSSATLRVRLSADEWAGVEVIGHMRDIEELSLVRFRMMLRMDDPSVPATGTPDDPVAWGLIEEGAWLMDPGRWARDRQYLRDDPFESASAFGRHRAQTLAFLAALADGQWSRGSIHPRFGRVTFDDWTAILAWHDDNHLTQLERTFAPLAGT